MQEQVILFTIGFVNVLRSLIFYAILGRIIMSWLTMGQYGRHNQISVFLNDITDPIINIARKIPHTVGMLDLAPLIAMFAVDFLAYFLILILQGLL